MMNWQQFKNLPKIQSLPPQEQARQFFIYQSDRIHEASMANAAAAASAAAGGAGAGGGGGTRRNTTTGFKYAFYDRESNSTKIFNIENDNIIEFNLSAEIPGSAFFAKNYDNDITYFVSDTFDGEDGTFGQIDSTGKVTIIQSVDLPKSGAITGFELVSSNIENIYESAPDKEYFDVEDGTYTLYDRLDNGTANTTFTIAINDNVVTDISLYNNGDLFVIGDLVTLTTDIVSIVEGTAGDSPEYISKFISIDIVVTNILVLPEMANSFFYYGDNEFIYYTGNFIDLIQSSSINYLQEKSYSIDMDGDVEFIGSNDVEGEDIFVNNIFKYNNDIWSIAMTGAKQFGIFKSDLTGHVIDDENITDITLDAIPGVEMFKVSFIFSGAYVEGDKCYVILFCVDKNTNKPYLVFASIDMLSQNKETKYLYSLPFEIFINMQDMLLTQIIKF